MGGSAKKPSKPAPAPAPVRADSAEGEQSAIVASRRQGLRDTIDPDRPTLGTPGVLGSIGTLGMGGEGVMINNVKPVQESWQTRLNRQLTRG